MKSKRVLLAVMLLAAIPAVTSFIFSSDVFAQVSAVKEGVQIATAESGVSSNLDMSTAVSKFVHLMLYTVGILAVIMLIFGGIKYVISGGDSKKVESAKATVLYALAGLIVALVSFVVVNFIISFATGNGVTGGSGFDSSIFIK